MADMTQLTGAYAASWLPWIMIPMIFYILPFPIFAIVFLWIEREGNAQQPMGQELQDQLSAAPAVSAAPAASDTHLMPCQSSPAFQERMQNAPENYYFDQPYQAY